MALPPRNNQKESPSLEPIFFPPGYKFTPTDEELIFHYLKPFFEANTDPYPNAPIHYVNIYESKPEQLTKKYDKGNDKEWFFITERTKRGASGKMVNRRDTGGTWNAQIAPKKIEAGQGVVGYKNVLDYRVGNGVKSDWLMHEYWFESSVDDNSRVDYALCKIFLTPRVRKRKAEEEENERRKKKMKEEVVATLVAGVDQPCNDVFQQPLFYRPPLVLCQTHQSLVRKQLHNVATVINVEAVKEEVDPCQMHLLQLQQPHNYAYYPQQNVDASQQQIFVASGDPFQPQEQEGLPILDISDELSEMMKFLEKPVVKDDQVSTATSDFILQLLDGVEESSNSCFLEEIIEESKQRITN